MKTFVIQIGDNNLRFGAFLPRRYVYEGDEYRIIHGNFRGYEFTGLEILSAVDVFFNTHSYLDCDTKNADWSVGVKRKRQNGRIEVTAVSFTKQRQMFAIVEAANLLLPEAIKDFIPIESYSALQAASVPLGTWVMKPNNGARGIGHIVFDTAKVSTTKVNEAIQKASSGKELVKELTEDQTKRDALFYEGQPHQHDEGFSQLKASRAFFKYIPNIAKEYRVITGHDSKPIYVIERKRVNSIEDSDSYQEIVYLQAQSDEVYKSKRTLQGAGISASIESQVVILLSTMKIPLHSVDLFVTEDGKWGIFEYAYEFGTKAVPAELLRDGAMKYVASVAKHDITLAHALNATDVSKESSRTRAGFDFSK